jgi:tetratricopeptide (TPR) repeat protein
MRFGSPLHPHWSLVHQLPLVGPTADYYALLLLTPTPRLIHTMTLHSFQKAGAVGILTGYLMMSLIIALFVRLMRREREAAWCFAGCGLLLLPVSNIYPMTTQTIAAYRAGTAGLFVAAVLGWAFVRLLERGKAAAPKRIKLLMAPVILYAAWMGCLTLEDDCVWKNSLMASRAVERYDPESNFAKLETANAYLEFGHFEPAIIRLDKMAARINAMPSTDVSGRGIEWDSRSGLADWAAGLYGRAGLLKLSAGDKTTALAVLLKGQALSPQNEQVNAGLATYALLQGDTSRAEGPIRNLLAVQPGLIGLRLRLGKILMQQQRWSEADIEFTQCLAQLPSDDRTYLFTALARLRAGNRIGAAQVLSDGENRRVLDKDKLAAWLKSLGEPDLLRSGGVLHVE